MPGCCSDRPVGSPLVREKKEKRARDAKSAVEVDDRRPLKTRNTEAPAAAAAAAAAVEKLPDQTPRTRFKPQVGPAHVGGAQTAAGNRRWLHAAATATAANRHRRG